MTAHPELVRLFATCYQAAGRKRLLEEDFVRLIALERRWVPPSLVRKLVAAARSQGLLRSAGAHAYELSILESDVRVPLDWRPSAESLEAALTGAAATPSPPPGLFKRIVTAVGGATGDSESSLVAGINQLQESSGRLLRADVAALVLAARAGLDVGDWCDEVDAAILAQAGAK